MVTDPETRWRRGGNRHEINMSALAIFFLIYFYRSKGRCPLPIRYCCQQCKLVNHIFTVRSVVAERLCFQRLLSFCSQVYPSMHWGRQPPADPSPWADTHWQTPSRADTNWEDTPRLTPPGKHPPGQTPPPTQTPPTATAADGTHPTGTHSC